MGRISQFLIDYWYVFAILGVVLLIYLWSKLDESTKFTLQKVFSGKTLFLIGFVATWYFWNKYGDLTSVSSANRWMPVFALMVLVAYNFIGALRYETQQIVCSNGFHGSFSRPPLSINGFLIFAIDSFSADGIVWNYAKRILVLREETTELFIQNAVSIASPTQCSAYALDPDVKSIIDNNEYLKSRMGNKPVFYGWFDDIEEVDWSEKQLEKLESLKDDKSLFSMLKRELGINNPSIKEMYRLYKNACKSYNKLVEELDSTIEGIEKGVEHRKRVQSSYIDKSDLRNYKAEGYEDL